MADGAPSDGAVTRSLGGVGLPGEPVVRRAPFAVNPSVGKRGKQAQRRILEAALRVFGEFGYEQCKVGRIAEAAGCSRVSFYQYFSSKEDVFRQLSAIVYQELVDAAAVMGPVTADAAGYQVLGAWFSRYGEIYDSYEPVYEAFQTATVRDDDLVRGARTATARVLTAFDSHVSGSRLEAGQRRAVIRLISEFTIRANRFRALVETGEPPVLLGHDRLNAALTDIAHRALFGHLPGVNSMAEPGPPLFVREPDAWPPTMPSLTSSSLQDAVLEAARNVFLERGYHAARIDDIAERAQVSHGAMYRYFRTKGELFRALAAQSAARFNQAFDELSALDLHQPDAGDRFRAWVQDYAKTCAEAAAFMRIWAEALARNAELGSDSAAMIRFSCSRLTSVLSQRGAGDPHAEALVMLAALEAVTTVGMTSDQIDIGAEAIERSFHLLSSSPPAK